MQVTSNVKSLKSQKTFVNQGLNKQRLQKKSLIVQAQQQKGKQSFLDNIKKSLAAVTTASVIALNQGPIALAGELDVFSSEAPQEKFILDDAGVLSRVTRGDISGKLKALKEKTGYTLDVVTTRKLEFEPDAFQFGDKLRQKWFSDDPKAGILLMISAQKDGAVVGGPEFVKTLGEEFLDSVTGENIPYYADAQKFNEGVEKTVGRIEAVLYGQQDPGAPKSENKQRKRTYKTKEETGKTKLVTATIVGVLLLIAFVVPMLQYFGYVNE